MNTNKISFLSKIVICNFLFAFLFISGMYAQSCNAELSVEKNRNSKSADEDGAVYDMVLTNTSNAVANYTISIKELAESCSNSNVAYRTSEANVSLDVAINGKKMATQNNKNSLSNNASKAFANNDKISVKPGQSYNFKVKVTVPKGTPSKRWSCIQVEAKSPSCKGKAASTVLKVFVPDPTEG